MTGGPTILLAAILLIVTGCSTEQWQRDYHAGIRQQCAEQGLAPDSQAGKECFARALQRATAPPPGAKPHKRPKSLEHFME